MLTYWSIETYQAAGSDGRVEPFIRFPLTRWQRLTEWDALLVAAVLVLLFAVIIEVFVRLIRRY